MTDLTKERIKDIKDGLLTHLIFLFSPILYLITLIIYETIIKRPILDEEALTINLFITGIISIILTYLYKKDLKSELNKFKKNIKNNITQGFKYYIIGFITMLVSNILLHYFTKLGKPVNEQIVEKNIMSSPLLMYITAGIIGPIEEELIFRKGTRKIFKNNKLFLIFSTLLFALAHVINEGTIKGLIFLIPYGALSLSFGAMYLKTNTIFTSILIHMIHNIIQITLYII